MKHFLHTCEDKECLGCNYCRGGLAFCRVCKGAEASLPTDCPGRRLTEVEEQRITEGSMDFVEGAWVYPAQLD